MFVFFVVFSQYLYLSLSKINVHCAQLLATSHHRRALAPADLGKVNFLCFMGWAVLTEHHRKAKESQRCQQKSPHVQAPVCILYCTITFQDQLTHFISNLTNFTQHPFSLFFGGCFYKVLILIKCCSDLRVGVKMFPSCCVRGRLKIGPTSNIAFYHHQHFQTQENLKFSFLVNLGSFTAQKEFILFLTNVKSFTKWKV